MRGEYMFVAEGRGGFRVYDVATIANKGFSERIVTAPFSPLGHDTHVASPNATCMALPTNQPIAPTATSDGADDGRPNGTAISLLRNQEQPFHPIYNYAVVTDAEEGLILVNVDTLADGEPRNNFLQPRGDLERERRAQRRAAHHPGRPLSPISPPTRGPGGGRPRRSAPAAPRRRPCRCTDARASALQFRYLWVTDAEGAEAVRRHPTSADRCRCRRRTVPLADARRIYVARTYAYVAAKSAGPGHRQRHQSRAAAPPTIRHLRRAA